MVLRYLIVVKKIILKHQPSDPNMKNAHKIFLLVTILSYVIMYGVMALLS